MSRRTSLIVWLTATATLTACGTYVNTNAGMTSAPATEIGTPDLQFDQLFTQNGPGWTGGDSTYSVRLPDGRTVWMFSDSYIGTVNPVTRARSLYLFQAHNCLVVQDTRNGLTTINGGTAGNPSSYFAPSKSNDWFWVGDGAVLQTSPGIDQLNIFLLEVTGNMQFVGNTVVTLSLPNLAIVSYQPLALPTSIEWGSALLRDGSWLYIYGIEDLGSAKYAHVARTTPNQVANPSAWTYWNGAGWVSGANNSARILGDSISNEFSVSSINGSYILVAMDTSPPYGLWKNIVSYTSTVPTGPWTNRTVVYVTPETGMGHLMTYNPHAHPEFTSNGQLLISYNVNSSVAQDLINADDYRPKFIRVPVAGLP